jgi:FkbM family methyltransferase
MISYAQNFEDVILRRVFRDQKDGFYIDVGAMDPVFESVTKFFYDQGWSGINIEPNEWFYGKLLEERPRDINLNLALGDQDETRELYVFERIGNSTFEKSSSDRYVERGFEATPKRVRVSTLAAICRDYVRRPIDFLKVDCEGWEKFVLKGADWDRFRPAVLIVEATEPGTSTPSWNEWEPHLIETARYEMVYFDGVNRFYIPREYPDLRCYFQLPPNFFDEFKLHALASAEQSNEALGEERDGLVRRMTEERENLFRQTTELEQRLNSAAAENRELAQKIAELERTIGEAEARTAQVDQELQSTRLWVGRLSQDLAASKRRG